jgi:hypothetical protein
MSPFLEQMARRLVGDDFSAQQLAETLRRNGGHDISGLSDAELIDLIEDRYSGNWQKPAFSFSEMLAYYSVLEGNLQPQQIVGWAFAAMTLGKAFRRGHGDIDMNFNSFLDGFFSIRTRLEPEESVEIFGCFFGRDNS